MDWTAYTNLFIPWLYFIGIWVTLPVLLKAKVHKRRWGHLVVVLWVMTWPITWVAVAVYRALVNRRTHLKVGELERETHSAMSQLQQSGFVQAASQAPKAFSKANSS